MNDVPPRADPLDDIDDRYRRASALDTSRPSEFVRRAVLEHAARLADERGKADHSVRYVRRTRRSSRAWRQPAIVGTLAAAALAGLLITPHFLDSPLPSARMPGAQVAAPAASAPARSRSADTAEPLEPSPAPPRAPAPQRAPAPTRAQAQPRQQMQMPAQALSQTQTPAQLQAKAAAGNSGVNIAAQSYAPRAAITAAPLPAARGPDAAQALRQAAEIGDTARVQALLEQPLDIDARDANGRTALLLATQRGHADTVDFLLAHGADPNATDAHGTTPLQAAVAGDYPQIAAALRHAGAR